MCVGEFNRQREYAYAGIYYNLEEEHLLICKKPHPRRRNPP